jgi:hypothetical protein
MWKKKYFLEKKKTPTIEDNSTQLKTELDRLHEKIAQTIDNECKHAAQIGYSKEAEVGVGIIVFYSLKHHFVYLRILFYKQRVFNMKFKIFVIKLIKLNYV